MMDAELVEWLYCFIDVIVNFFKHSNGSNKENTQDL